jgi:hypothetical protein
LDAERGIGERRVSSDDGRSGYDRTQLSRCARADRASYFRRYASLSDETARETALSIWAEVNGPNLVQNILPTRGRTTRPARGNVSAPASDQWCSAPLAEGQSYRVQT